MKHKLALLLLVPLTALSCSTNKVNFQTIKKTVDNIEVSSEHPYYRVIGTLDFANSITEVNALFDQMPNGTSFVPYSRYNTGFYNKYVDYLSEEDTVLLSMGSRSYWLRAPLKLDKANFYVLDEKNVENSTDANYILNHIILAFMDGVGSANPSTSKVYYEKLSNGGFAIGGDKVHSKVTIDNYPCYPEDGSIFGEWKERNPLPAYKNVADGKFNIRFEYDKNGWLKRESLYSINYDYNASTSKQVGLESRYYYQTGTEKW